MNLIKDKLYRWKHISTDGKTEKAEIGRFSGEFHDATSMPRMEVDLGGSLAGHILADPNALKPVDDADVYVLLRCVSQEEYTESRWFSSAADSRTVAGIFSSKERAESAKNRCMKIDKAMASTLYKDETAPEVTYEISGYDIDDIRFKEGHD